MECILEKEAFLTTIDLSIALQDWHILYVICIQSFISILAISGVPNDH